MRVAIVFYLTILASTLCGQENVWVYLKDKPNKVPAVSTKTINRYNKCGYQPNFTDAAINKNYVQAIAKLTGVKIRTTSKWLNAVSVSVSNKEVLPSIEKLPFVLRVHPVKKMGYTSRENQELKSSFLGEDSLYGALVQLNAQFLPQNGFKGKGKTIAVIDNGFKNCHQMEAFAHVFQDGRVLGFYDFVDNDTTVFDASAGSHGQMVWSFMGAKLNETYCGTSVNANYWLFRTEADAFENVIEEDYWMAATEMADSVGVDIITSSLSYTTFDGDSANHTYQDLDGNTTLITQAADNAAKRGIFVAVSAGNYGGNSWNYIGAPADGDSVLAVGAADKLGTIASFSSFGPTSDGRTKPDVLAWGRSVPFVNSDDQVRFGNGTSFSTPIVSGLVASLWEAVPNKTANEIRLALIESSSEFNFPHPQRGHGIPDFCKAYKKLGGKYCYASEFFQPDTLRYIYFNSNSKNLEFHFNLHGSGTGNISIYDLKGGFLAEANFEFINENGEYKLLVPLSIYAVDKKVLLVKSTWGNQVITTKVLLVN